MTHLRVPTPGDRSHVVARASSHTSVTASRLISSANKSIDSRDCTSYVLTGPPRKKLRCPAGGPPLASIV